MKELWELYITFVQIGCVTFGGGYAMLPILERELVDKRHWTTMDDLRDYFSIGQCTPGVIAMNVSTFIGQKKDGVKGAIAAGLGFLTGPLVIITLIAMFFREFQDVPWVAAIFAGIRPAVVALIAVPTWNMARKAQISFLNCWIPIVSALLIFALGVNPIYIILAAGVGGYVYGLMKD